MLRILLHSTVHTAKLLLDILLTEHTNLMFRHNYKLTLILGCFIIHILSPSYYLSSLVLNISMITYTTLDPPHPLVTEASATPPFSAHPHMAARLARHPDRTGNLQSEEKKAVADPPSGPGYTAG